MYSFWDFNALYLYSQDQQLPLGPGILWEKSSIYDSPYYTKRPMVTGVSRGQIEWLNYLQTQDICIDSNGVRQTIQTAMNVGEYKVNGKPVDGYMIKDGKQFFFEYYGCYYHPGCCVPDSKIRQAEKRRKLDNEKFQELSKLGEFLLFTYK